MRLVPSLLLPFLLGFAANLEQTAQPQNPLCRTHGTIAFVQYRTDADLKIRFVASGEAARISFHRNRSFTPGMWRVVAKNEDPDYRVYVDPYKRNDTIDVRIVDVNPGCAD